MKPFSLCIARLIGVVLCIGLSKASNAAIVDVLVVYTQAATTVSAGKDIAARTAAFIEYANQAYENSSVDIRLRSVGLEEISLTAGDNVSSEGLTNLANDTHVKQLRDQYGADLVVLLTRRQESGRGFLCGIGYVPGGSDGRFFPGAKFGGFSVSAVDCGPTTPVHEFGHNMGLGHSWAQGSNGGIYPWARGHGEEDKFATIMAYPSAYGRATRVQQFSSPEQIKCKSASCGVDRNQPNGADSVRNLNIVAKQIADFFPTKVAGSPPVLPDSPVGNLVPDGSFDRLDAWESFYNAGTLVQTSENVASQFGLLVTGRSAYYAGPLVSVPLESTKTYELSAFGSLATSFSGRTNMNAILFIDGDQGSRYQPLGSVTILKDQWSELNTGPFALTDAAGNINSVQLLIYGPPRGWDFYLDEINIKEVN